MTKLKMRRVSQAACVVVTAVVLATFCGAGAGAAGLGNATSAANATLAPNATAGAEGEADAFGPQLALNGVSRRRQRPEHTLRCSFSTAWVGRSSRTDARTSAGAGAGAG